MKKGILLPRSAKGQSLVEFAISLVILLYLLSGAVEFGIAFFQFVQLRDAAQEGALYGSTHPDDVPGMIDRIKGSSASPIDLSTAIDDGTVTPIITIDGTDASSAGPDLACEAHALAVRLEYQHVIFMPFVPRLIGRSTIPLNATVTDTILTPMCPSSP